MAAAPRRLDVIFGEPTADEAVITWELDRSGDRVVVAARHRDRRSAFRAALSSEERMAAFQPVDAAVRGRVETTPGRIHVIVHAEDSPPSRVLAAVRSLPAFTTHAFQPRVLP